MATIRNLVRVSLRLYYFKVTYYFRTSNTFRAYKPQELQDPMVAFAIFSSIMFTHAPQFATISSGLDFVKQVLITFMLGFAVATCVSLFVLPITNRRNFFLGGQKYVATIEEILGAQRSYIRAHCSQNQPKESSDESDTIRGNAEAMAGALNSQMVSLIGIHDTLHGDLSYAKTEIAWGKLSALDLDSVFSHLRSLLLPLAGISLLPDILKSLNNEWKAGDSVSDNSRIDSDMAASLESILEELNTVIDLVVAGTQHALLALKIRHPKNKNRWFRVSRKCHEPNVERADKNCIPGGDGFASNLAREIKEFTSRQQNRHISSVGDPNYLVGTDSQSDFDSSEEFLVLLCTQHLLRSLLKATLDFVRFADGKIADGSMQSSHVIIPRGRLFEAWIALSSGRRDVTDLSNNHDGDLSGEAKGAVDPEHLPPANAWERFGNALRYISRILASDQSIFGFRAAAASSSVAILAFLHQTQDFFLKQRLIWVLIVIAFGMSPTSGAGLFSFVGRILATIVALVLSLIVWYIVNGHIAGVITFLYIANVFAVRSQPNPYPHQLQSLVLTYLVLFLY